MLDVFFFEDAVEEAAAQGLATVAFLEIAAEAHVFVGQGEDGFADPAAVFVIAFFYDKPGVYFEVAFCLFWQWCEFLCFAYTRFL